MADSDLIFNPREKPQTINIDKSSSLLDKSLDDIIKEGRKERNNQRINKRIQNDKNSRSNIRKPSKLTRTPRRDKSPKARTNNVNKPAGKPNKSVEVKVSRKILHQILKEAGVNDSGYSVRLMAVPK